MNSAELGATDVSTSAQPGHARASRWSRQHSSSSGAFELMIGTMRMTFDHGFLVAANTGAKTGQPVGSTAVREIIERYQPMLSVHGHIHESRGHARVGHTLALNAGSECNTRHIHGAVSRLRGHSVTSHQHTVG